MFKVFNMITNRNETKTLAKNTSCDWKWKPNALTCNSDQKWNNESCQWECENYRTC